MPVLSDQQIWDSLGSLGICSACAMPGWRRRFSSLEALAQLSSCSGAGRRGGHQKEILPAAITPTAAPSVCRHHGAGAWLSVRGAEAH